MAGRHNNGDNMTEDNKCDFCEQPSDELTIGTDGVKACADCIGEAD